MTDLGLRMHAERTPNPNSVKWVLGRRLIEGAAGANFEASPAMEVSPLAGRLFAVEGVIGVFIAANFATITKRDDIEWIDIAQPIADAIKAHLESGESVLGPDYRHETPNEAGDLVARIRRLLDEEVRPAIARDGGDIVFEGFEAGVVRLQMIGACSGCPSSAATLKLAVESRLREEIPEVQEVVAV